MAVRLVFSNLGAGKTTYLAKIGYRESKRIKRGRSKYKRVVADTPIRGCMYVPDLRKQLMAGRVFKETLILVDEGGLTYNNRLMKMTEKEIEFFKLSRHYKSDILICSQSYEDVDITLRRLYKELMIMRKFLIVTLVRKIKKTIGINEEGQIVDEYKYKSIFSWRWFVPMLHYAKFDSWFVPKHEEVDYTTLEVIENVEKGSRANRRNVKKFMPWTKSVSEDAIEREEGAVGESVDVSGNDGFDSFLGVGDSCRNGDEIGVIKI